MYDLRKPLAAGTAAFVLATTASAATDSTRNGSDATMLATDRGGADSAVEATDRGGSIGQLLAWLGVRISGLTIKQ